MSNRLAKRAALLLSLFGLAGRLIWAYIGNVRSHYLYGQFTIPDGYSDAGEYVVLAHNLAYHHTLSLAQYGEVLPTPFRAPLYPLLISLFWWNGPPIVTVTMPVEEIEQEYGYSREFVDFRFRLFQRLRI